MTTTLPTEPKLKTFAWFPNYLRIDGQQIDVRIKRQTNSEAIAWGAAVQRWSETAGPAGESFEARMARELQHEQELRAALDENLQIFAGQIIHEDQDVTRGSQLLDIYGGRFDVVPQAIALITTENRLSVEEKKTYRSVLDSSLGLPSAPSLTPPGGAPAPTAGNAGPRVSAPGAAATASVNRTSSGTTARSGSARVRSAPSRRRSGRRSVGSI